MTHFYFEQNNQTVSVKLSTDQLINAWSGEVILPANAGQVRLITADSLGRFWPKPPQQEGERIVFIGGMPNGFTGSSTLFQFEMKPGEYSISFNKETVAYLNDGLGSKIVGDLGVLNFRSLSGIATVELKDETPPQQFSPYLYEDKNFFNGQPVLVFETKDLESGVNHYEVREFMKLGTSDWHRAESPYLVNSDVQKIEVKAIDNFNNERTAVFNVSSGKITFQIFLALLVFFTIILFVAVYNIRRWRKKIISRP